MNDQIALATHAPGEGDYIPKMNQDNRSLEYFINLLLAMVTGQSITTLAVPQGLQQIFDRRGLIGVGSYDLSNSGHDIYVSPGAYWSGLTFYFLANTATVSMSGLGAGTYYINLDASGHPLVSTTADQTTTRQFAWNGVSLISSKVLYAGVSVLFDGDDYADMLTSAARSKSFTQVATRLEEIEVLLGKNVQTPASANTINVNCALGNHVRVLLDRATTTFNFAGAYDGQRIVLELLQDEIGGRAIAFGSEVIAGDDLTLPIPLSTDPDKTDLVGVIYSDGLGKYMYNSLARGFAA